MVAAFEPLPARGRSAEPDPDVEFRAIYDSAVFYVVKTLRRLGVHERDLEDVAHDVFVTLHRRLSTYDRTRPLRPWVYGFALRVASAYRRSSRATRETMDDGVDEVDPRPTPDEAVDKGRDRRIVIDILNELDLDRRAIFVMHDLDGLTMPEIAEALEIPLNTAYSRLRLARAEFTTKARRRMEAAR